MNTQPTTKELLAQDRFELVTGEIPIIEGLSTYLESALNAMSCHAVLTNYRIVVCKKSVGAASALFGLARDTSLFLFFSPLPSPETSSEF